MATWHQSKAGFSMPDPTRYILVSDGPNVMRTQMSFGLDREAALRSLENHRRKQPGLFHTLYFGGRPIA